MFLCEKCLDENYTNFAIPISYGKCENCEENKPCVDIPSNRLVLKDKSTKHYDENGNYLGTK